MSKPDEGQTGPKSMRHRRILDVAAENPDASVTEIATEVPSATADLVEHVFEEYGDPAEAESTQSIEADTSGPTADGTESNAVSENDQQSSSRADLSEKQLETLRAIAENPEAPQRELAETLDVSAATVSTRVNDIEGFEWADRATFARTVVDTDEDNQSETAMDTDPELQETIEELTDRVETIERRLAETPEAESEPIVFGDAELTHKMIHACMASDQISEEEELRILQSIVD